MMELKVSSIEVGCFVKHSLTLGGTTGGWWHLNWGERARGNECSGIGGMVSNT